MKNLNADLPEVSWATVFVPGLVGPKLRPKGVSDGQRVNIPVLLQVRPKQRDVANQMIGLSQDEQNAGFPFSAFSNGVTRNDRLSLDRFPGLSS